MQRDYGFAAAIWFAACMGSGNAWAVSPQPIAPPHPPNMMPSLGPGESRISGGVTPLHCTPAPCTFPNVLASGNRANPVVETPIAADPTNPHNLISAGVDYNCAPGNVTYQGYYVTTDGGKHWTDECGTPAQGTIAGDGDPIIGYDLNGNVYRGGIDIINGTGQWVIGLGKSTDHGITWSTPVIATQVANQISDKPWFAADDNPKSPYLNTLYVSSTAFDTNSNTTVYVSHSTDGGQTWATVATAPQTLSPAAVEGTDMAVGADGTVYLAYLFCAPRGHSTACSGGSITQFVQTSKDGGNSWSAPVAAVTVNDVVTCKAQYWGCIPNTHERVLDYPSIAIDRSDGPHAGRLYLACWNWTGSFMQVLLTASDDGGNIWSTPVPVAASGDDHDQYMHWLDVSPSGLVGVTWLDRRNDPNDRKYEAFAGISRDGGSTFANFQLATKPSDPKHDGFQGTFLGDYRGSVWAGPKKLFAAWPDTRNRIHSVDEVGGMKQ